MSTRRDVVRLARASSGTVENVGDNITGKSCIIGGSGVLVDDSVSPRIGDSGISSKRESTRSPITDEACLVPSSPKPLAVSLFSVGFNDPLVCAGVEPEVVGRIGAGFAAGILDIALVRSASATFSAGGNSGTAGIGLGCGDFPTLAIFAVALFTENRTGVAEIIAEAGYPVVATEARVCVVAKELRLKSEYMVSLRMSSLKTIVGW